LNNNLESRLQKAGLDIIPSSEERLRLISEFTYDWEYWLAPDGSYLYMSPSCERVTGYSRAEFLRDPGLLLRIIHPEDRPRMEAHLQEEPRDRDWRELDLRIRTRSGEERWIGHVCQPVYASDGTWLGWRGTNRDITLRQRTEQELRHERDFAAAILSTAGALIVVLDGEGRIVRFNRACEEVTGYSQDEIRDRLLWDVLLVEEEKEAVKSVFAELIRGRFPNRYENIWLAKDGSRRLISWSSTVLLNASGGVEHVIGIGIDVTEQRQAEEEREQLLARFEHERQVVAGLAARLALEWDTLQTIMEHTHANLAYLDPQFNFLAVNSAYCQQSGHSREELLGRNHFELFPNTENQRTFQQVRDSGEAVSFRAKPFEYLDQPERGMTYWDWTLVPVKDADGRVQGLVFSLLDVTEQMQQASERERLLHENRSQREFLESLVHSAPVGVAVVRGEDHRFELVNTYYESVPGTQETPAAGRAIDEVFREDAARETREFVERAYRRDERVSVREDRASEGKVGQRTYWDLDYVPLHDVAGEVERVLVLAHDVTEQVQAENALRRRNEELQALTRELDAYAHTVAHDLKQPLAILTGYTDLLYEEQAGSATEYSRRLMDTLRTTAAKMTEIVESLLLLADTRQGDVEMQPLDMHQVVSSVCQRLAPTIQEHGAEIALPDGWPTVLGYEPWVESVWMNYVSNAIKYSGSPVRLQLGSCQEPDGMVRFWIDDNGSGLTIEEQSLLFTAPLRLTAAREKAGHGLGLTIVRRIVERLGGEAGVEDAAPQGSRFWFTLRAAPGAETG
jgi:PAS domain S-box-containing protein